jgi:hypothetical protein
MDIVNNIYDKQRRQLAAQSLPTGSAKPAHIQLGLPRKHAIPLQPRTKASVGSVFERQFMQVRSGRDTVHDNKG